jgi:hypothetical protein
MYVKLEPKILNLVASLEADLAKAVHEALTLWLKERLPVCPLTNQFCEFNEGPCNDCPVAKKHLFKEGTPIRAKKSF